MKNNSLYFASTAVLTALLFATAAQAQSVDYTELQQMFGEPVTTSATGKPQRVSDVPADMLIITQDQIRRSGAHRIVDVLKFVPGLDVREYANGSTEVSVHGYIQPSTPRLLVLVNGRQIYLDSFGFVSWNSIPVQLAEIQQIEVVKGPASSLFGFNAVAGVINIITIDPQKTQTMIAQATGGTYDLQQYSLVIAQKISDDLAVKASGGYSRQGAFPIASATPFKPMNYNATVDVRWQVLDNTLVSVEGTWLKSHAYELQALGSFMNSDYMTYSYKANVLSDTAYGLMSLTAYHNHMSDLISMGTDPITFYTDLNSVSLNDLFKVTKDVTVRLATEYRFTTIVRSNFGKLTTGDIAGSAMVDWAITPELSLTNAFRIDEFSPYSATDATANRTREAFSYNTGLVWKVGQDDTIRVTGGRSNQTPSLISLTQAPTLDPSALDNVELSLDHNFADIASKVHLAVYREWYSNLMGFAGTNLGGSSATGVEITIEGALDDWRWNASLHARSVKDNLGSSGSSMSGYTLNFANTTPKYVATFGLGKTWGDFEFDLLGKWQSHYNDWSFASTGGGPGGGPGGGTTTQSYDSIPAYVTLTGRVGWKFTDNFTIAVSAEQLNKQTIYQGSSAPVKPTYMITLTSTL